VKLLLLFSFVKYVDYPVQNLMNKWCSLSLVKLMSGLMNLSKQVFAYKLAQLVNWNGRVINICPLHWWMDLVYEVGVYNFRSRMLSTFECTSWQWFFVPGNGSEILYARAEDFTYENKQTLEAT